MSAAAFGAINNPYVLATGGTPLLPARDRPEPCSSLPLGQVCELFNPFFNPSKLRLTRVSKGWGGPSGDVSCWKD